MSTIISLGTGSLGSNTLGGDDPGFIDARIGFERTAIGFYVNVGAL